MNSRLVGVREIAKLLSVTRQRADQLVRIKDFPDPVAELKSGRVWKRSTVVRWAKEAGRSVPWATVELELEQLPQGPAASAANRYRAVWEITRMKALGRNPEEVPRDREYAHTHALAAARQIDPSFAIDMPSEVDDEADARTDPMRRMIFKGADLWFARAGDDNRGYWHIEWDGYEWWVRQCFVADGSGWNLLDRRSLGFTRPGAELKPFLQRALMATELELPADIAEHLLQSAIARTGQAFQ
jgi:predicted DNA-binding transcriptional regulator AlpA